MNEAATDRPRVRGQDYKTRKDWLEKRRHTIGASDAAAVLGLSPFQSPLSLWADKTRLSENGDEFESEEMLWGKLLEPVICEHYSRTTGFDLQSFGEFHIFTNSDYDYMSATLDRGIAQPDKPPFTRSDDQPIGDGVLEAKTTNAFSTQEWTDTTAPLYYQIQLQHALLVTERQWGSLAVLIGGNRFRVVHERVNERFVKLLAEQIEQFWFNHIVADVPPPPDGSKVTAEAIHRLYPHDSGETIPLPQEFADYDVELVEVKAELKKLEERKRFLQNQFRARIADATFGELPDGARYSLKTVERNGYTVEPTTFRTLRRLKKRS